jgi:CRISPR-associated protein Csy1
VYREFLVPRISAIARLGMSSGNVDDETAALSSARVHLANGQLQAAAAILRPLAKRVTGAQATLVAELLIAARLLDDAVGLAIRVAIEQSEAWPWINNFAGHMRARGDLDASRRVVGAFIAAHPARSIERMHADITSALGLPSAYRDITELNETRDKYLRQLREFVSDYPPSALLKINARADDLTRSNFSLAYQGGNDLVAQSTYGDWLVESIAAVAPSSTLPPPLAKNGQPTIAFVSSKWHECTVGWYFAAWVKHLCRSWNVTLVHTPGARRDTLTLDLAATCRSEIMLSPTIESASEQIRALGANIVLYPELGTDGFTFALAAQRLAPLQACAWGHPVTSGLPTVDVFFTCAVMEPVGAEAHYRERLIGLPGIGTRYVSPPLPASVAPRDIGLPDNLPLYLMPQALHKWHPDTDQLLVEIVRRDPSARFVLFELRPPSPARIVNERLLSALGRVSRRPAEHLIWMPECSRADYLRINQACRVMVDTPHWSGGNASLDALQCGLPIVTLPGRFMRGRQSTGMLQLLGCEELIARSVEELADIAVALAHNDARRKTLSEQIRQRLASLTQSESPLLELDAVLRKLVSQ